MANIFSRAEEGSIFNRGDKPWLSFLVLVLVFLGIAALWFIYKTMKRREQMRLALQGRRALDRDIEVASGRRYRHFPTMASSPWTNNGPSSYTPARPRNGLEAGHGRVRTANRWAWATNLNPRASRREEGLNELGEAPPPYEPAHRKEETGVSLGDLPSSRDGDARRGTGGAPQVDGNAEPVTAWSALTPPAYGENGMGRPAPAVLPPSQRYG